MKKIWEFIKRHKVLIIVLALVGAIAIWLITSSNRVKNQLPIVDASIIEQENLANSINVDGIVESENSKKVFTQLALPVEENVVEVGDFVKAGDVIGRLDPRTLEETITQQRATIGAQQAINQNSIELANKQLEFAKGDMFGGQNLQVSQAEQAVILAEEQLNQAEVGFNGAVRVLQEHREYSREIGVYEKDGTDTVAASYIAQRDSSYASYELAKSNLEAAKENLENARNATYQQMESYDDNVGTTKVQSGATQAQMVAVEHLEADIARAVITSPIDGVVTAVYAVEGTPSSGLLYVIEDLSNLKITAALKEYDLAFVGSGDLVKIKSDATGDDEYSGKLVKVAPTTIKNQAGDNMIGGTGEFSTEISVSEKDSQLKIGTKARVDIIYDEKSNVITVPYEALAKNKNDEDVIYIMTKSEEDETIYNITEMPIQIGMEGDFKVEVISSEIKPGDMVVKNAENVPEGMKVHIMDDVEKLAEQGHLQALLLTMEV